MTKEEFKNIKIGDTIYSYLDIFDDIDKYFVLFIDCDNLIIRTISDNETTEWHFRGLESFYTNENFCTIDYIKDRKIYLNLLILTEFRKNKLFLLDEKYKEFIKENIEYFI